MCPGESEHRKMVADSLHVPGAAADPGKVGTGSSTVLPREGIRVSAENAGSEQPCP